MACCGRKTSKSRTVGTPANAKKVNIPANAPQVQKAEAYQSKTIALRTPRRTA